MNVKNPYQTPPNIETKKATRTPSKLWLIYPLFLIVLHINFPVAVAFGSNFSFATINPNKLLEFAEHSSGGSGFYLVIFLVGYLLFIAGVTDYVINRNVPRSRVYIALLFLVAHFSLILLDTVATASV